ncbi:Uncharacterised protein [Klebsiella pneumoniae]|nr:Uncharacterised protein [Escherichia coli]SWT42036.1 Uncharacterised protein [Klebsiella pneumoniae]
MQRFLEHVANCTLCITHGVIKWNRRNFVTGEFRAAQNKAHLRAITVG